MRRQTGMILSMQKAVESPQVRFQDKIVVMRNLDSSGDLHYCPFYCDTTDVLCGLLSSDRQRISSTSFMPSMFPDSMPSFAWTQSGTAHGVSFRTS